MTLLRRRRAPGGWVHLPAGAAPAAVASFPLRAAAVDMGSNGIRFLAAEFRGPGDYRVLESDRAAVRLGQGAFQAGRLQPKAMAAALQALARFRKRMQILDIRHFRVVATSAVRESANGEAFARQVRRRLGLNLEIITGAEEARLVCLAVKNRIAFGKRTWTVVNVGGGSVELALADHTGVLWSESHTLGAVRLLQELSGSGRASASGRFQQLLSEYVSNLRFPPAASVRRTAGCIATGGNIEVLARLAHAPLRRDGTAVLALTALRRALAELAGRSYAARVRQLKLKKDRADVILPAAVVYERLCALSGKPALLVPFTGTKEGILLDLVDNLTFHAARAQRQEAELLNAAVALGRHYRFDEAHSLQVARLALSLFEQVQDLHGLGEEDARVLLAAAVLHDVGTYIGYKRHHKHSLYLLSQSELPGLTQEEMLMVANVARYHRKTGPKPSHEYYMRLPGDRRARVAKLASLLRLADALDREHAQNVHRLRAALQPGRLTLEVAGEGGPDLERWAVKRKAQLFTDLFRRKVRVIHSRKEGKAL